MKQLGVDVSIAAASDTAIPGLGTVTVVADGKRRIRVTFTAMEAWRSGAGVITIKIWENGVGGTLRKLWQSNVTSAAVVTVPPHLMYVSNGVPAAGTYVFTVSVYANTGQNANINASLNPMTLLAELF